MGVFRLELVNEIATYINGLLFTLLSEAVEKTEEERDLLGLVIIFNVLVAMCANFGYIIFTTVGNISNAIKKWRIKRQASTVLPQSALQSAEEPIRKETWCTNLDSSMGSFELFRQF